MDGIKILFLLLALTGVVTAAPKHITNVKKESTPKSTVVVGVAAAESVVKPSTVLKAEPEKAEKLITGDFDEKEKLQTADSIGLAYYLPLAAPVVNPLPVYTFYNYYPGYYHSYRHHGYGGYGHFGFNYNVGVLH